ncbi:MAG: peptidoglycan DD-metalloendopeptidase family protein [Rhodobacteraceae bacterium]|nr:peptidoglycan DD-metalloendopeptidase family protein [Paracoccaceae bacterium]
MPRLSPTSLSLGVLLAALTAAPAAWPQSGPDEAAQLRALEQNLERGAAERDRLAKQQQSLARELDSIARELVTVAQDIQNQEYSLTVLENRLGDLGIEEAALVKTLGTRDAQLAEVLMALQRLAIRPADALTLSPLKPDDAVRTAILLRAAVPSVQQSARALQGELAELYRVRADMTAQRQKVAAGAAALIERQRDLEKLEQQRRERQVKIAAAYSDATGRVERLGRDAADLRELVEKLTAERERREAEARRLDDDRRKAEAARLAAIPPDAKPEPPPAQPQSETRTASLSAPMISDLRPFSKARGSMPMPVVGSVAGRYGEADQSGGLRNKGINIVTRSGAQVIAPFDGIVAFAGPFRGYGLLLIIEHSEGYHTLLAGLGRVDCAVGQRVLAGEPVGVMESGGSPSLYVELRRDGQPVNPLPWMASRAGKSNG